MAGKVSKNKEEKKVLEERLARALADYQNLVKRVDRERVEIISRANSNLLKDFLPILDILEVAQSHLNDQGLGMALAQSKCVLAQHGVKEVEAKIGDQFDAQEHEATDSIEGDDVGKIAEIVRKGYKWQDGMILRPTQVKVYTRYSDK